MLALLPTTVWLVHLSHAVGYKTFYAALLVRYVTADRPYTCYKTTLHSLLCIHPPCLKNQQIG